MYIPMCRKNKIQILKLKTILAKQYIYKNYWKCFGTNYKLKMVAHIEKNIDLAEFSDKNCQIIYNIWTFKHKMKKYIKKKQWLL